MTLDEAKRSAKEGIVDALNGYAIEVLPTSALLHVVVWRLNAVIDGLAPTTGAEALVDAVFNFVVALQTTVRPFFQAIDAATTVEAVWAAAAPYDPRTVPPPSFDPLSYYESNLETIPE